MAEPTQRKPGTQAGSLLDRILAPANLAEAWDAVAENAGMPGADGVRISRYRRNWEERLAGLAADVAGNRYRPAPLRIEAIPKRGGGWRRIGVPTLDDRVLQRAALQALQPRLDRRFLACSYGYRPRRGVGQAVARVIGYRDRGLRWLLEADIDDCFGSLDHELLRGLLRREVREERVLALMDGWLEVGRPHRDAARGIALGMPISPLWANLYLHEMDWQLVRRRWSLVRYADDFIILTASREAAEQARAAVIAALTPLKLALEPSKTGVACFEEGFEFLGVRFKDDCYSFTWQQKRITVEGRFDWLWSEGMRYEY